MRDVCSWFPDFYIFPLYVRFVVVISELGIKRLHYIEFLLTVGIYILKYVLSILGTN